MWGRNRSVLLLQPNGSLKLKMALQGSKNVWGKCNRNSGNMVNEHRRASLKIESKRGFGNDQGEPSTNDSTLALGAFVSKSTFGTNNGPLGKSSVPVSLPKEGVQRRTSKIFLKNQRKLYQTIQSL